MRDNGRKPPALKFYFDNDLDAGTISVLHFKRVRFGIRASHKKYTLLHPQGIVLDTQEYDLPPIIVV